LGPGAWGRGRESAGAELREIKNARHQGDEACEIQGNDAAGEAGEAEREEELPGAAQPAERPLPALRGRILDGNVVEGGGGRGALGIQVWIGLGSIKQ